MKNINFQRFSHFSHFSRFCFLSFTRAPFQPLYPAMPVVRRLGLGVVSGFSHYVWLVLGVGVVNVIVNTTVYALPYVGIGADYSLLQPEVTGTAYSRIQEQSFGGHVNAGYVLTDHWAAELRYSELGAAEVSLNTGLSNSSPGKSAINYRSIGLGGAYYFPEFFQNWTAYARLGVNHIQTRASVPISQESAISPWLGLGTQIHLGSGILANIEANSYSADVKALSIGVIKFWSGGSPEEAQEPEDLPEEYLDSQAKAVNEQLAENLQAKLSQEQERLTGEDDGEVDNDLIDKDSSALLLKNNATMDEKMERNKKPKGVFHKDNAIASLYFDLGASAITAQNQVKLQEVLAQHAANDGLEVVFVGHTCDVGNDGNNQQLSLLRAASAQQYFVGLGIRPEKTKATAFGAVDPKVINDSEAHRQENRRVDVFFRLPTLKERLNGLE